jgi:uroporphyrin-3 C-methyltransferase
VTEQTPAPLSSAPPQPVAPPTGPVAAALPASAPASPLATRWFWGVLALLGALSVVSLLMVWRTDQRSASLELELVRRQQDSAGQSTEARMLAKQAQQGAVETAAKVALLEARLAEVTVQRSQFEEVIQSLSRSRDENLLGDVEAAIRVALQQTAITGSAEPLVATLKQSDERLARYNQPRLEGVRRAIARDLDRVKAVSVTDISSLSIKLDEAVRMVDELPLLAVASHAATAARRPAHRPGRRRVRQWVAATCPRWRAAPTRCGPVPASACGTRSSRWCACRASTIPTQCCWHQSNRSSCAKT